MATSVEIRLKGKNRYTVSQGSISFGPRTGSGPRPLNPIHDLIDTSASFIFYHNPYVTFGYRRPVAKTGSKTTSKYDVDLFFHHQ